VGVGKGVKVAVGVRVGVKDGVGVLVGVFVAARVILTLKKIILDNATFRVTLI
jgi:hypothetical protein